jgi:glucose/arabinose dehydrogenase
MHLRAIAQRGVVIAAVVLMISLAWGPAAEPAKAEAGTAAPSAAPSPLNPALIKFRQVGAGFDHPVAIVDAGDGSGRLFIVEKTGYISILRYGRKRTPPFLDVHTLIDAAANERGLLGLAFHPDYVHNGYFYTVYTAPGGAETLSRWTRSATDPNLADAGSQLIVMTVPHSDFSNHNGGNIAFGADGYLYWSIGDGGGSGDQANNAQNLNILLGKLLRIDVDHTDPGLNYSIPTTNPLYNTPGERGEIWAYGLRNTWRFSFDRQTHDLYLGDVGQNTREEIDFQPAGDPGGENYGWHVMEGGLCYNPPSGCNTSGKVLPVAQYDHSVGCSVTGGFVYRGTKFELLRGHYLYGDYCTGKLFDLYHTVTGWVNTQLLDTPYQITAFGQDEQGNVYLNDYGSGKIYRILYKMVQHYVDFNGDGKTDLSVFRPSTGMWLVRNQSNSAFGAMGDIPVPGDYNGDGKTDAALFTPSTGTWSILGGSSTVFGQSGDVPVQGDYNGDGTTDLAYYRPSTNTWNVFGKSAVHFGQPGDIPVPGDYDGNGTTDFAVFRPSTGTWYVKGHLGVVFGKAGDIPVQGDYNGDGITEISFYRPSTHAWAVRGRSTVTFGNSGDIPVPGDYNKDGKYDIVLYRPSNGTWYARGLFTIKYGTSTDYPIPAPDTNGDGDPYQ